MAPVQTGISGPAQLHTYGVTVEVKRPGDQCAAQQQLPLILQALYQTDHWFFNPFLLGVLLISDQSLGAASIRDDQAPVHLLIVLLG